MTRATRVACSVSSATASHVRSDRRRPVLSAGTLLRGRASTPASGPHRPPAAHRRRRPATRSGAWSRRRTTTRRWRTSSAAGVKGSAVDADVLVVGYGPVGQVVTPLLARQGWRATVLERWPRPYRCRGQYRSTTSPRGSSPRPGSATHSAR
ncbi:FAD-dependent monooxygenase [Amycolatopsis sp. CA-126428]|uniref:FAD-dependent monooxygenase n=1 Tax=Amycolatopsis sp. CA-126428 TaxID=2073158 RepID=UPI003512C405